MKSRIVVSDTTPLIALEKISNGFDFIQKIYDKILVPRQVLEEVSKKEISEQVYLFKNNLQNLLEEQNPSTISIFNENQNLDDGEKYAIALAVEKNLPILIHERKGRRVAKELNLKISGIAGEIWKACINRTIEKPETLYLLTQLHYASQLNSSIYNRIVFEINKL